MAGLWYVEAILKGGLTMRRWALRINTYITALENLPANGYLDFGARCEFTYPVAVKVIRRLLKNKFAFAEERNNKLHITKKGRLLLTLLKEISDEHI